MKIRVDLRLHPRLHRPGRRRPDPPAGRADRDPAHDPEHGRLASLRRGRNRRVPGSSPSSARPGPSCLIFSRQNLPHHGPRRRPDRRHHAAAATSCATPTARRRPSSSPPAPKSNWRSRRRGAGRQGHQVRVVSMPSTNVFDAQDAAYKDSVLPKGRAARRRRGRRHRRLVEVCRAATAAVVGLDRFGESAPAGVLFKEFGFTVDERRRAPSKASSNDCTGGGTASPSPSGQIHSPQSGVIMLKVGINGFGRIGRMVFRAIAKDFPGHRNRRHQRPARARLPGLHAQVRLRAWPLQGRHRRRRQQPDRQRQEDPPDRRARTRPT